MVVRSQASPRWVRGGDTEGSENISLRCAKYFSDVQKQINNLFTPRAAGQGVGWLAALVVITLH